MQYCLVSVARNQFQYAAEVARATMRRRMLRTKHIHNNAGNGFLFSTAAFARLAIFKALHLLKSGQCLACLHSFLRARSSLAFFSPKLLPNQSCFLSTSAPETRFDVSSTPSAYHVAESVRKDAIPSMPSSSLIGASSANFVLEYLRRSTTRCYLAF